MKCDSLEIFSTSYSSVSTFFGTNTQDRRLLSAQPIAVVSLPANKEPGHWIKWLNAYRPKQRCDFREQGHEVLASNWKEAMQGQLVLWVLQKAAVHDSGYGRESPGVHVTKGDWRGGTNDEPEADILKMVDNYDNVSLWKAREMRMTDAEQVTAG